MPAICLYVQVHQPFRLRPFSIFDVGDGADARYFDDAANRAIVQRVADKCYLPANRIVKRLLEEWPERFAITFSITGTALDQMAAHAPAALASFRELATLSGVEFLCETDVHSLSAIFDWEEFDEEVIAHRDRITALTGHAPTVFRNTELIYSDALARRVEGLGFRAVLADGVPRVLNGRTPGHAYRAAGTDALVVLTKYPELSDDIAFRFSDRSWSEWPMTAETFAGWVRGLEGSVETINLFLDYETFGEHQWASTGIFAFLAALPGELFRHESNRFLTASTVVRDLPVRGVLECPEWISWADVDRDLTAWLGDTLQRDAAQAVYAMRPAVLATGDPQLLTAWRRLLTSDHFYYMCLKWFADGDVHKYFSPFGSPYDAYIYYMNALQDLRGRCGLERSTGRSSRVG